MAAYYPIVWICHDCFSHFSNIMYLLISGFYTMNNLAIRALFIYSYILLIPKKGSANQKLHMFVILIAIGNSFAEMIKQFTFCFQLSSQVHVGYMVLTACAPFPCPTPPQRTLPYQLHESQPNFHHPNDSSLESHSAI